MDQAPSHDPADHRLGGCWGGPSQKPNSAPAGLECSRVQFSPVLTTRVNSPALPWLIHLLQQWASGGANSAVFHALRIGYTTPTPSRSSVVLQQMTTLSCPSMPQAGGRAGPAPLLENAKEPTLLVKVKVSQPWSSEQGRAVSISHLSCSGMGRGELPSSTLLHTNTWVRRKNCSESQEQRSCPCPLH